MSVSEKTPALLRREQGWVHARGKDQYRQDRVGIDMPARRPDAVAGFIRRLRAKLSAAVSKPWWRRWSGVSRGAWGRVFQRRKL